MAMEVPVVASPLAADGLNTEDGDRPPVTLARTADDFARSINAALDARTRDLTPDTAAREYILRHFVWSAIGERLRAVLRTTVKGG